LAAFATEIDPAGLRFKPMTRCEDACASGSVAIFNAIYALEAGRAKAALVIGVEKMNLLDTKGVTHALATCSYWPNEGGKAMTFPALFAEYAKGYKAKYNIADAEMERILATVAALCYANGLDNPLAHFGKGGPSDKLGLVTAEAILNLPPEKNPVIADPLKLHDCSLVTDGAAALVLMKGDIAKSFERKVQIAGIGHTNERFAIADRPNMYELEAGKEAARLAYAEAGITPSDIDIAEVHDCFTINQLLSTEALGLSSDGRSGMDYIEGRFTRNDKCAINLSGGLKAKGHPVGATGVSIHAQAYKQLVGQPIGAAPTNKKPEIAVTYNVGGSSVTNCVSVLKR
jgi:acetyl-CoA C-acetyltransferase